MDGKCPWSEEETLAIGGWRGVAGARAGEAGEGIQNGLKKQERASQQGTGEGNSAEPFFANSEDDYRENCNRKLHRLYTIIHVLFKVVVIYFH